MISSTSACDYLVVPGADSVEGPSLPLEALPLQTPAVQPSQTGSTLELKQLFQAQYAAVWRLLRRFGVPPSELDDAAQEVFWVTARRLGDIQPGSERAFLYGVALRTASNILRRERAMPNPSDPELIGTLVDTRPSPEEDLDRQRARGLLDVALGRLAVELRTVFVLYELEGLPVKTIAELEEIPLGTAHSRLRRAREEFSAIAKRLRAALLARDGRHA